MSLQKDLTKGNITKQIVLFSLPIIISNIFQALYNMVDMLFISKYMNTEGIAAVSSCGPVMNTVIMTIAGLSVGISIVVGNMAGVRKNKEVKEFADSCITLYAILAVIISIGGYLLAPFILKLINTPQASYEYALVYLRIIFLGMPVVFGYNLNCAFQRGFGDSLSPMLFIVISTITNIILDYIFIAVIQMDTAGAALATVLSQTLSYILGIVYFEIKKHIIRYSVLNLKLERKYLRSIYNTGFIAAVQQLLLYISLSTLNGIANSYGVNASAAYGIGVKVDSIAVLPSEGMNMAMVSFSSQNIAKGQYDRALKGKREATVISVTIAVALAAFVCFFSKDIVRIFDKNAEVVRLGKNYLRISCIAYILFSMVHPQIGFIRGSGNVRRTLYNTLITQYLIRIPCAIIFSNWIGFKGIAIALVIPPIFSNIFYRLYIKSEKWKLNKRY